jgi:hypothetical protein
MNDANRALNDTVTHLRVARHVAVVGGIMESDKNRYREQGEQNRAMQRMEHSLTCVLLGT